MTYAAQTSPLLIPRLLVFDLDGTLIDSSVDLCNAVNATLKEFHRPILPASIITSYIGDGAAALVRGALSHTASFPADEETLRRATSYFLSYYRVHMLDETYVYEGVIEALQKIRAHEPNLLMAVLTNKPAGPSRAICDHFGLDRFFFRNYGGDSFDTKKPHPLGLRTLIQEATIQLRLINPDAAQLTSAEVVMIGDSDVDMVTARVCLCRSLGCTYGLAREKVLAAKPEMLAHAPSEWPDLLLTRKT